MTVTRLLGMLWPFVSRRKHKQAIEAEKLRLRECRSKHVAELEEHMKCVDAIIPRLSELQWIVNHEKDKTSRLVEGSQRVDDGPSR